jgi:hypothetical protein
MRSVLLYGRARGRRDGVIKRGTARWNGGGARS